MSWIKDHIGTLIVGAGLLINFVLQWATYGHGVKLAEQTAEEFRRHQADIQRHVDPVRDGYQWAQIMDRLRAIEQELRDQRSRGGGS